MGNFYNLSSAQLNTQKPRGLEYLDQLELQIPKTITFNDLFDKEGVMKVIGEWREEYCYIRLCFSDNHYPHHFSSTVKKEKVLESITEMKVKAAGFNKVDYDIIVQPIINFDFSGVALIRKKRLLVEIVYQHPIALLRHGEIAFRFLFNERKHLCYSKEYNQELLLAWENGLLNQVQKKTDLLSRQTIEETTKLISTDYDLLYEFGVLNGKVFYLESKEIPDFSYCTIETMEKTPPFEVFRFNNDLDTINFEKPVMENIQFYSSNNNYIHNRGPYLSHPATYCAINGIGCRFLD